MPFQKDTITRLLTFILVAYAAQLFDLTPKISPWAADVSGSAFTEMHRATDVYMSKRMPIFVQSWSSRVVIATGSSRRLPDECQEPTRAELIDWILC